MGASQSVEEDHRAVGAFKMGDQADEAVAHMFDAEGLGSRIRLMIRAAGLADMDEGAGNVSDPFVVVYLKEPSGALRELGRTECVVNNLSPVFVRAVHMTYKFEEVQRLLFRVFDVDTFTPGFDNNQTERLNLAQQDFIGECECDLASIMGRHGQTHTMTLHRHDKPGARGSLTVTGEEAPNQNACVRLTLWAADLPKGAFSTPDCFLLLERMKEAMGGTQAQPCYKTEVVKKNASPRFKQFEVGVQQLCGANFQQPVRIKAFAWDASGQHKLLGQAEASVDDLLTGKASRLSLKDPRKHGATAGALIVHQAELIARPSFLDYIKGGCEINFTVAVDFTASNGDPADLRSLHYVNPYGNGQMEQNAYVQAILSVGSVLEHYDTDKMYPVFGFGARVGPHVSHCFALNGDEGSPEVHGMQGVLQAYQRAIRSYPLAGPTFFSEVIQRAAACATHCTQSEQRYQVLLIITDGIINDMDKTISAIVYASELPLSILIVGVGDANFDAMDVLDGDEVRLGNAAAGFAKRDIVQFVPIRQFRDASGRVDRAALSRALLDEIPGQLLSYMQMKGMPPNPPLYRTN